MVKCECETCGYVARTTRKWLDDMGAPHCPAHGAMTAEPGELDGLRAEMAEILRDAREAA